MELTIDQKFNIFVLAMTVLVIGLSSLFSAMVCEQFKTKFAGQLNLSSHLPYFQERMVYTWRPRYNRLRRRMFIWWGVMMVSAVGFVARFTMHPKLELLLEWGWWRSDLDWIFILTLAGIFLTTLWAGLAMQEAYRDGVTCERWLRYKRRHRNGADMEALFRESYQYEQLADRRGARQTAITIGIIGLGPILVELILVDLYVHRNGFSLYVGGHGVDFFSLLLGLVCFGGLAAFCFALAAAWWAQSRVPQSAPP